MEIVLRNQRLEQSILKLYTNKNKTENADFQSYAAGRGYITMLRNAVVVSTYKHFKF